MAALKASAAKVPVPHEGLGEGLPLLCAPPAAGFPFPMRG